MSGLCLLVDGLGVGAFLSSVAQQTWARLEPGGALQDAWLVRDSHVVEGSDHPGFTVVEDQKVWIHQPLPSRWGDKERETEILQELQSDWSPPDWGGNETLILEGITWHVLRRLRLLGIPQLQHCDWLGYFRANSVVNTGAVVEVLRFLSQKAGWSADLPLVLGRGIIAEQHGVTMPALSWGEEMLEVIWSSRGIFMNRAALKRIAQMMTGKVGRGMPAAVYDLTRLFLPKLPILQSGLVFAFGSDSYMQGLMEFVFAATLRARDPELRIRWMPNQTQRFMEESLLLERFAFRLAAATYGWSKMDWTLSGLPMSSQSHSRSARWHRKALKRFSQGKTKLWGSCLWKDVASQQCHRSLLPPCILVFYPVETAELMRDLHSMVSKTACVAGANLRSPGGVPVVQPSKVPLQATIQRRQLFTKVYSHSARADSRASPWCQTVTKNRQLLSRLMSFSWSPRPGGRSGLELVSGRGTYSRPCPKLHFAPRLRPLWEQFHQPLALHQDEWVRGPSGQLRLKHPVTILLSLPNSGTTWIMSVLEEAQKNKGCIAGNSDILHPNCNSLLMTELAKIAGAPDHESWPNIFESPPPAAMDLLFDLVTDQIHGKAISEIQQMRLTGFTLQGAPLPPALVWPWKGWISPKHDATRAGLVLTKEIINVFQVSKYLEMRQRSGLRSDIVAFALYRHRAHCFPMSNESLALCKECWYQQMLKAFETADFSRDPAMRGIQRFWRSRGRLVGGREGPSGMVFAHLVAWFPLLRAQPFGLQVLDYTRLILLDRDELRKYLNQTLPGNLIRKPGVEELADSFMQFRLDDPAGFLSKRERSYLKLGAEPFARATIAEMQRLAPHLDLSLLFFRPLTNDDRSQIL